MCYSMLCEFQDNMGECRVQNFKEFKERFGWDACTLAGTATSDECEEFIKELEHNLVYIYNRKRAIKFVYNRYAFIDGRL